MIMEVESRLFGIRKIVIQGAYVPLPLLFQGLYRLALGIWMSVQVFSVPMTFLRVQKQVCGWTANAVS